jgi:hypothetical protein
MLGKILSHRALLPSDSGPELEHFTSAKAAGIRLEAPAEQSEPDGDIAQDVLK